MATKLREAREATGWSQNRLVREIEIFAGKRRMDIATTASLRVYISEWENGRRSISEKYSSILRALLGWTDEELFVFDSKPLADADGYEELIGRIESSHAISRSMVGTFLAQTELLRTHDRQLGASGIVDHMGAHLNTLQDALTFAVLAETRRPIAQALAGAATLAAWQALDVGAADRAWRNYEIGKRAALEADDPMYLAHAMGEQAFVLSDTGKSELALQLVREAQNRAKGRISSRLIAWLSAAEADLCAMVPGEESSARRALELASEALPDTSEERDPELPSIFLNTAHLDRWRAHTLALLGEDAAVSSIYEALSGMDSSFERARSGLLCDLAQAHMARGEWAEATEQVREARRIANRTGSIRFKRKVGLLESRISGA